MDEKKISSESEDKENAEEASAAEEKAEKNKTDEDFNDDAENDDELLTGTVDVQVSSVTETVEACISDEEEDEPKIIGENPQKINFGKFQFRDAAAVITLFIVPRIMVIGAIVCFLFNFMSITYGGKLTDISGKDLIFGGASISLKAEDSAAYEADGNMFNWIMMLAGIAALGALLGRSRDAWKCGIASAVLIMIFRVTAKMYYQMGEMTLEEFEINGWMTIKFGSPIYISAALLVIASVWYFLAARFRHNKLNNKYWKPEEKTE